MSLHALEPHSDLDRLIGERVLVLMFRQKVTQVRLASALGLNQAGVARRLRGETSWKVTDLSVTAELLKTTIAYLAGEVGDPSVHPLGLEPRTHWFRDEGVVIPIEWAFHRRERQRELEELVAA